MGSGAPNFHHDPVARPHVSQGEPWPFLTRGPGDQSSSSSYGDHPAPGSAGRSHRCRGPPARVFRVGGQAGSRLRWDPEAKYPPWQCRGAGRGPGPLCHFPAPSSAPPAEPGPRPTLTASRMSRKFCSFSGLIRGALRRAASRQSRIRCFRKREEPEGQAVAGCCSFRVSWCQDHLRLAGTRGR